MIKAPPVRFEQDTLKVDMLAAYPILMPLHVAEFSYQDSLGKWQAITYVVGAWETKGSYVCYKKAGSEEWQWSYGSRSPPSSNRLISHLDMYPNTPISGKFNQAFDTMHKIIEKERAERRNQRHQELEILSKTAKGPDAIKELEKKVEDERELENKELEEDIYFAMSRDDLSQQSVRNDCETKGLKLLEKADWNVLEMAEKEAYHNRVKSPNPGNQPNQKIQREKSVPALAQSRGDDKRITYIEPRPFQRLSLGRDRSADLRHPDRENGLGEFIFWSSPNVQRFSTNHKINQKYLSKTVLKMLLSRKHMASAAHVGGDVDDISVAVTDGKENKKDGKIKEIRTIRSIDLECRINREKLKPKWMKQLEAMKGYGRKEK